MAGFVEVLFSGIDQPGEAVEAEKACGKALAVRGGLISLAPTAIHIYRSTDSGVDDPLHAPLLAVVPFLGAVFQHWQSNSHPVSLPCNAHVHPIRIRSVLLSDTHEPCRAVLATAHAHTGHRAKHTAHGDVPSGRSHVLKHGNL